MLGKVLHVQLLPRQAHRVSFWTSDTYTAVSPPAAVSCLLAG